MRFLYVIWYFLSIFFSSIEVATKNDVLTAGTNRCNDASGGLIGTEDSLPRLGEQNSKIVVEVINDRTQKSESVMTGLWEAQMEEMEKCQGDWI